MKYYHHHGADIYAAMLRGIYRREYATAYRAHAAGGCDLPPYTREIIGQEAEAAADEVARTKCERLAQLLFTRLRPCPALTPAPSAGRRNARQHRKLPR